MGVLGPSPPDLDMISPSDVAVGLLGTSEFEGHMLPSMVHLHSFGLEDPCM
jgi:hypothetical protein